MVNGIHINKICKKARISAGKEERIFEEFSLSVDYDEVVGIFGPNGCGKTTLLNMISGIIEPDSGHITIGRKKPGENSISYIFQDFRSSLFPWLSIRDNILFPLVLKKWNKSLIAEKLCWLTNLIRIPFSIDKYPYQLSGGQQQYAAIIRGLISDPDVMLMDEPFSALDCSNGEWLMDKLLEIREEIKIPTLIVAHDIEHLFYLSSRVIFLSDKPAKIILEKTNPAWNSRVLQRINHDHEHRICFQGEARFS